MTWYGWVYVASVWKRVCSDPDISSCSAKLDALYPQPRTNLHLALTQGSVPSWTPRD